MESEQAILAFAALAQSTRLDVFRLLMEREPDGLPAGEIARHLAVADLSPCCTPKKIAVREAAPHE
jgi:hypothetical protein